MRIDNKRVYQWNFSDCWYFTQYGQVVHLVKIADFEKIAEPKATENSVAKSFGVAPKTTQNIIANKELLRVVEIAKHSHKRCHPNRSMKMVVRPLTSGFCRCVKSMVKYRSLKVRFVRKQSDLKIYLTNRVLKHPKDGLLIGKIVMNWMYFRIEGGGKMLHRTIEVYLVDLQKPKDE